MPRTFSFALLVTLVHLKNIAEEAHEIPLKTYVLL